MAAAAAAAAPAGPVTTQQDPWKPYPRHSETIVFKGTGKRAKFPPHVVDSKGPSEWASRVWGQNLKDKYKDGEDVLVLSHLHLMAADVCAGKDVQQPTNKYAQDAVEGLLITIQGLLDHGVTFG